MNKAGEKLLGQPVERLMNADASSLDLAEFLEGEAVRTAQRIFNGQQGRWGVSRSVFRENGLPHQLAGNRRPDAALARSRN